MSHSMLDQLHAKHSHFPHFWFTTSYNLLFEGLKGLKGLEGLKFLVCTFNVMTQISKIRGLIKNSS